MAERKFAQDKVYLQGPNGKIWEYEAMLARQPGFKSVVPNASKKATKEETSETGQGNKDKK